MNEENIKRQLFEYQSNVPFVVFTVEGNCDDDDKIVNHWHSELEICYVIRGNAKHIINGECVEEAPGRLIVTNSDFMHAIVKEQSDELCMEKKVVILIAPDFLKTSFPEYSEIYFLNEKVRASDVTVKCIEQIMSYMSVAKRDDYDFLYARGLAIQLLHSLCLEGVGLRENIDDVNNQKDIERIKGVLQYIQDNYSQPISQAQIARKFYFHPSYFSRYFKKCVGTTFTKYLTDYRLERARSDLLYTDKQCTRIALDNGFYDDRRMIIAFKNKYNNTPLQYRKLHQVK